MTILIFCMLKFFFNRGDEFFVEGSRAIGCGNEIAVMALFPAKWNMDVKSSFHKDIIREIGFSGNTGIHKIRGKKKLCFLSNFFYNTPLNSFCVIPARFPWERKGRPQFFRGKRESKNYRCPIGAFGHDNTSMGDLIVSKREIDTMNIVIKRSLTCLQRLKKFMPVRF